MPRDDNAALEAAAIETERTLRTGVDLARAGLIPAEAIATADKVAGAYPVAITPDIAQLIDSADPNDPIARQFLPDPAELEVRDDEDGDPIGDRAHSPVKGIVHRYPDRALLTPLLACPVYCRFCFRRDAVGPDGGVLSEPELDAALDYIASTPTIRETILTGGDPLILSDRRLAALLNRLDAIPHIELVRLHSRVPVADPARLTEDFAVLLDRETPVYLSIHANHPREITAEVADACRRVAGAGVPLLGQTVLLAGVNDDAAILEDLFRAMLRARIRPYYLHQLDQAPGTARFRVSVERGQSLMHDLRGRISGTGLPTYVVDIPGGHGKVPVGPDYLDTDAGTISDPWGGRHGVAEA